MIWQKKQLPQNYQALLAAPGQQNATASAFQQMRYSGPETDGLGPDYGNAFSAVRSTNLTDAPTPVPRSRPCARERLIHNGDGAEMSGLTLWLSL